jgi:cation transport ATPase
LWKIPLLLNLIKHSRRFILINLGWAFAYNIFILPIAAGAFYTLNFTISPMIASAAMCVSSIVVVLFSNLLRVISFDPSKD